MSPAQKLAVTRYEQRLRVEGQKKVTIWLDVDAKHQLEYQALLYGSNSAAIRALLKKASARAYPSTSPASVAVPVEPGEEITPCPAAPEAPEAADETINAPD